MDSGKQMCPNKGQKEKEEEEEEEEKEEEELTCCLLMMLTVSAFASALTSTQIILAPCRRANFSDNKRPNPMPAPDEIKKETGG